MTKSPFCAALAALTVSGFGTSACNRTPAGTAAAVRLVDLFKAENVTGAPSTGREIPRTEWRFDTASGGPGAQPLKTGGWEGGPGVGGFGLKDGRLAGRSTSDVPLLHIARTPATGDFDLVHAIEVRMRVSAGGRLAVSTSPQEKIDLVQLQGQARADPFAISSPLTPGDAVQTYTLTPPTHIFAKDMRHLLLRPSDVTGADFAIESVRVIFRKEYLASIPSGVTWQGLKEIYRESIAARAPETIRLAVTLPEHAWLDLGVGTVEDGPVTFRVDLQAGKQPAQNDRKTPLVEHTVTTPHRWEPVTVDLDRFSGQDVTLTLAVASEQAGAIGFWGAPVVRSRVDQSARGGGNGTARRPRGVILIQADTLRRDHLGVYGYGRETAPLLRTLAGEGTLFKNYTVQATWTKVSTPTLMTSLYPSSHGVVDFADHLPASAATLAESFRAAGYATVSFSSILFTGQLTNLHKGFEELHEDGSVANPQSSKTAREFVDRLSVWLDAHRGGPFFAFLHVFDPHDPYEPHAPYNTLWAEPAKKEEHERQSREVRKVISDPIRRQFGMPTREELVKSGFDPAAYVGYDQDWYDGSIRGMDVEIGRLVERLRGLGLDDDTLLVFLSDHGEEFLEHGRTFHGQTVYGELTQTPLIMRWPAGIPKGRSVDEVVQTIDVMPTLLELSGIKPPAGVQGQSLTPLLAAAGGGAQPGGNGWKRRPAITEKAKTTTGFAPPPGDTESYAIVDAGWKLIHNVARPPGTPEYELYDFVKDPINTTDVAAQHPDVVARLGKALDGWHQMATTARLKPDTELAKTLSPAQLQRLRSLGYVR